VGNYLYPEDGYAHTNKKRGVLTRTLRSSYYYAPFLGLAYLNPWALAYGAGVLLLGLVYGFVGLFGERKYSVAVAEAPAGWLIGELIALSLKGAA
jgi:hypothetical protein